MRDSTKLWMLALPIILLAQMIVSGQQAANVKWFSPTPRPKAKTLFAPRPSKGDNIFTGEAEKWLADVAIGFASDGLTSISDAETSLYVAQVGQHLVAYSPQPNKKYEFTVTRSESANAMTAGGGRIFINLGLLRLVKSEDELAGILAHEISHDAFAHAGRTITRQLFWMKGTRQVKTADDVANALTALFESYRKKPLAEIGESLLGFSRFDELEADRAAFYLMYKAGYNPRVLREVMRRMEREYEKSYGKETSSEKLIGLMFSSHPPTAQRTLAFSWEGNFIKMPPKDECYNSQAFQHMKLRLAKISIGN